MSTLFGRMARMEFQLAVCGLVLALAALYFQVAHSSLVVFSNPLSNAFLWADMILELLLVGVIMFYLWQLLSFGPIPRGLSLGLIVLTIANFTLFAVGSILEYYAMQQSLESAKQSWATLGSSKFAGALSADLVTHYAEIVIDVLLMAWALAQALVRTATKIDPQGSSSIVAA